MRNISIHILCMLGVALVAACGDDDGDDDDDVVDAALSDAPEGQPDAEEGAPDAQTGNAAPTASFEWAPPCTETNQTEIAFTSTSTDPDGDTLTCSWIFDDGTPGTAEGCEVTGVTFPNIQPYPVTLTVDDGNGGTDSTVQNVPPCD